MTTSSQKKVWRFIMAGSTKKRRIKEGKVSPKRSFGTSVPSQRSFGTTDPGNAMQQHPSWNFIACDTEPSVKWSFCKERLTDTFWDTIFPKLQNFETMTLSDIFVQGKKQNHGIDFDSLSALARSRLDELHIEAEALHSLRLGGTLRLYGILTGSVFSVIWYDDEHGDNPTCVCRSHKRHT